MRFDQTLIFFDASNGEDNGVITGADTYESAAIDLNTVVRSIGKGNELEIDARLTERGTGGTSIQLQLVSASDTALTTDVSVIIETPAVPIASLSDGYRFAITALPKVNYPQRYIGLRAITLGIFAGGARIDAGIVSVGHSWEPWVAEQGNVLS